VKIKTSKVGAERKIDEFFTKKDFTSEEVRKIKRLAMKFKIRLSKHRAEFCKKCLAKLRGRTRVSKIYKTIICEKCNSLNKIKIQKN
jgi:RNase P subunit RPR2